MINIILAVCIAAYSAFLIYSRIRDYVRAAKNGETLSCDSCPAKKNGTCSCASCSGTSFVSEGKIND